MVKPFFPLLGLLVSLPCAAKELSEVDFLAEMPVG